jgi:predicted nucleic acid-binding protein
MTGKPALVDTNILCYAFDAGEPEKREAARELLSRVFRNEETLSVSVQNLAEFSVVAREKMEHPLPDDIISRFIGNIAAFEGWNVVRYDAGTITRAIEISRSSSLHFWEALLVATMQEQGINTIWTEDAHFSKIAWLTVKNPFRQKRS